MLRLERYLLLIILLLTTLPSCDNVKKKAHQAADKTKAVIAEKKENLGDKLIARYDPYHPDTKFNKKRFAEFFLFTPTADVKNIYCHADEMGIDHDYQFSFNCDTKTINKIILQLNLNKAASSVNYGSNLWHNYPWWDSAKIVTLKPFFKKGDHENYSYLWYDPVKRKAYYFAFDL